MSQDFFERVYEVASKIPEGRVTTYGAIAEFLGSRRSARVVGWAMNQCHNARVNVPAHRVVNRIGLLSGKSHFEHPELMQKLLEEEGVQVVENQVQDFEQLFWNPSNEL